jgi:hypothetical protein
MQGRKTADFMPLLRHCRWELSVLSVFIEQYASEPQTLNSNSTSVFSNRTTRLFLFCSKVFCSLWAGMNVEDRNGLIYIYIYKPFSRPHLNSRCEWTCCPMVGRSSILVRRYPPGFKSWCLHIFGAQSFRGAHREGFAYVYS